MTVAQLESAIKEARRFMCKADLARMRLTNDKDEHYDIVGCRETAACRRASMDLTRELARLRK